MESAIVVAKGQVVIPKKIRAMFHIKQGTRVHFEARNDEIVLTPLTPRYFERMAGCLEIGGKATKALLELLGPLEESRVAGRHLAAVDVESSKRRDRAAMGAGRDADMIERRKDRMVHRVVAADDRPVEVLFPIHELYGAQVLVRLVQMLARSAGVRRNRPKFRPTVPRMETPLQEPIKLLSHVASSLV